jgi:2,3-dihydroxybenzoate decarboxylase
MKNKIALEEHFAIELTIGDSEVYARPEVWAGLKSNLLDFEQQRIEQMDA